MSDDSKPGDLRIWWIPQVPMQAFRYPVASLQEGARMLHMLALYDLFQLEHRVKPDFCNVGGLEVFEDGEWSDWYDEETGDNCRDVAEQMGWLMP